MELYFFKKPDDRSRDGFHEIALHHNVRTSKLFAFIIGVVGLVLSLINQYTNATRVLLYPNEYYAAILFIFIASWVCYFAFVISKKMGEAARVKAYKFFTNLYALIVIISSLWITFVMQHNPSNTMSIFVLGILSVASLWIFEKLQAIAIALLILILFNGGLHYFQTDACKLFTNYITGTCVAIFFVCISRVNFSVNYNYFKQLKKIEHHNHDIIKANEKQTEILAVVAHDLRAPINSIKAITDLLRNADNAGEDTSQYLDMIVNTCNRSNTIIEDLLSVARKNEKETSTTLTCLNDFVHDVVHQFIKMNRNSRCVRCELPDEKLYANINHQKMQRVFENLLTNAVKFTNEGGQIVVKLVKDGNNICVSVTDDGIGIPGHMIPLIFSRFSEAGRTGLNGEQSHGLGLNICQVIMKQHYGDISASSTEGNGTQIKITLPPAS